MGSYEKAQYFNTQAIQRLTRFGGRICMTDRATKTETLVISKLRPLHLALECSAGFQRRRSSTRTRQIER
jgi:hypothetical protein